MHFSEQQCYRNYKPREQSKVLFMPLEIALPLRFILQKMPREMRDDKLGFFGFFFFTITGLKLLAA